MKGALISPLPFEKKEGGFTPIELLITAAIAASFASIPFPMRTQHASKSRQQDARVQLIAIQQAQEMYKTRGNIDNDPVLDVWIIDQDGTFTNTTDDAVS